MFPLGLTVWEQPKVGMIPAVILQEMKLQLYKELKLEIYVKYISYETCAILTIYQFELYLREKLLRKTLHSC